MLKKILDPTGFYAKIDQVGICAMAAGYVPAFITQPKEMLAQLMLSHNVTCYPTATFKPTDLTLTMDLTGVSMKPIALIESELEKVWVYNHGLLVWVNMFNHHEVYLVAPKEETMRLRIRNS